jgi:DNA polymerase-3 subunit delta'
VVRRLARERSETHAVLFYGSQGSGKEEMALILAQIWLCRALDEEGGADGACQVCGAFERGTNPDVLQIRPVGPSALLKIDQFVNSDPQPDDPIPLLEFFRTGPLMSRHKVAIVTDAHRMNSYASNALLKTLEEPLPHAKLILTTDSIGGIRPTILSRCLAVACSTPVRAELEIGFPGASATDILLAEGAPGRLQTVLKHPTQYHALADFARNLRSRPRQEALTASEEFRAIAERLGSARDLSARAANAEALSVLAIALARSPDALPGAAQAVIQAHQRILGNASPGVVFDALFARILA